MAWHFDTAMRVARDALKHIRNCPVKYASGFSGIDIFATALDHATHGKWSHMFASEHNKKLRRALELTYSANGLCTPHIYDDIECDGILHEPTAHIYVLTPPCGAFSSQNRKPQRLVQAKELAKIRVAMQYVTRNTPKVVIIENVANQAVMTPISAEVARTKSIGYTWTRTMICPHEHLQCAVKRPRSIWMGVLTRKKEVAG